MLRIFGTCALLYVLTRALMVLALGDVFFYGEELEKGAVAKALLDGVDVAYARLPFHPYEGGGFVASHLKALAFLVVGENVLAHKVAATLWGLLIVLVSVGLCYRFGRGSGAARSGGAAGMIAGVLISLGPAHFQKQSLVHLGIHYEALFFVGAVFWLGLVAAGTREGKRPRPLTLFALGLASGFGTYFSYQVPMAVMSVIVLLALTDWRRIFAWQLVVGTLLGLLPLVLMYGAVGMEILDIHGSDVGGEGGWARLWRSLGVGLRSSTLAGFSLLSGGLAVVAGLVHARPSLRGAGGERGRALALTGGFAVLWILFAGASGMVDAVNDDPHWIRWIRFAPLVYAALLFVALCAGPAVGAMGESRSSASAKMARIGVTLLVSIGAVHLTQTVDRGSLMSAKANLQTLRSVHGFELRGAFVKVFPRVMGSAEGAESAAKGVAPFNVLKKLPPGFLAQESAAAVAHVTPLLGALELGPALTGLAAPGAQARDTSVALGSALFRDAGANVEGVLSTGSIAGRPLSVDDAEALGRFGPGFVSFPPYVGGELKMARTAREREAGRAYVRGLGRRIFRSGVMQLYWGPKTLLSPAAMEERIRAEAQGWGAQPGEVEDLLAGVRSAAIDFGFPR